MHYPNIRALGPRSFELIDSHQYVWLHDGVWRRIVIPAGFRFDGASSPRLAWLLISPLDLKAADLYHDWLYRFAGDLPKHLSSAATDALWDTRFHVATTASYQVLRRGEDHMGTAGRDFWEAGPLPWTRKQAEELFARMMRENGVPKWKRRAAYLVTRALGWRAWRRNQR